MINLIFIILSIFMTFCSPPIPQYLPHNVCIYFDGTKVGLIKYVKNKGSLWRYKDFIKKRYWNCKLVCNSLLES